MRLCGAKQSLEDWHELAPDEPRKKQRLFCIRVESASNGYFSGSGSNRRGKAGKGQFLEPSLRLRDRPHVLRIEIVPGISGVIHYDLGCHRQHS
jgi:hypothetical protein